MAPSNLSLGFPESSGIAPLLQHLQELAAHPDSPIRAIRHEPARPGDFVPLPGALSPALRDALASRGVTRLFTHQAESFEHAAAGRNVVVVTPTASGKTLCYNLPVLHRLLADPGARALYLFPTKALAEDQLHELNSVIDSLGAPLRAFTYDGDTAQDARKAIRERANVVLTNPDMLHSGILPHHTRWAKLFENLRYVIIDELHSYRGVYGSHFANILRRLRRICDFYGSRPQFVCSSATIANPKQLAEALTESPFELVDRNGAPSGEKYFVFYNPPVVNRQLGIRRGYLNETRRLATEFIDRHHQLLVFANSRIATEVLVTYLKDAAARTPLGADAVRGYRGGYLPRERREIERKLRDGAIRAVVSTSALELGIDIGALDAVILAGYPGTVASTWQRAGRAGRRQTTSLAVLVASSAPLDQYIVEHPDYFFDLSPEQAHINPDNLEMCHFLEELKLLHHSAGAWHWTSDTYPADAVSLRSSTSDNFVVVDITHSPEVIAEVGFPGALTALHEKAIYLHEARQYQVEKMDYEQRKAYVRRVACDYYTDAIDYTQVKVLEEFESSPLGGARAVHGEVRLNTQVIGFKKIKFYTLENVGAGNLSMPEQEMHTTAFWLHFPQDFLARLPDLSPTEKQNALCGLGNALRTVAALLLMADPHDLGVAMTEDLSGGQAVFEPNLYLYDNYSGGIGQSAPLHQLAPRLLQGALDLISACPCEAGCPSCVGPVGEIGEHGKQAAQRILAALLSL
jgi:DEAD/DEAH box helicase domain-containing protein